MVPNYNGICIYLSALGCLSSQTLANFEVIVVDNASTDDSVSWVREHHPEVKIIQRAVNGGPVKSTNDGIRASRGEYVVILLDNDNADADWLATLVAALDEHPQYDFAIAKMLVYEEDQQLLSAGAGTRSVSQPCRPWYR